MVIIIVIIIILFIITLMLGIYSYIPETYYIILYFILSPKCHREVLRITATLIRTAFYFMCAFMVSLTRQTCHVGSLWRPRLP